MQQEIIFNVFESLFPAIYNNLLQFMEPKMEVSLCLSVEKIRCVLHDISIFQGRNIDFVHH